MPQSHLPSQQPLDTQSTQFDSVQAWNLVALSPQLGELSIAVGKSLSIGRSDNNDVVLPSPQVSRQHAKINRIGDNIYVQDLGSANGTFVNGERISTQAVHLQDLDELAFAELLFVVNQEQESDDIDGENILAQSSHDTHLTGEDNTAAISPAVIAEENIASNPEVVTDVINTADDRSSDKVITTDNTEVYQIQSQSQSQSKPQPQPQSDTPPTTTPVVDEKPTTPITPPTDTNIDTNIGNEVSNTQPITTTTPTDTALVNNAQKSKRPMLAIAVIIVLAIILAVMFLR